jgi:replicative DNA helicase
MTSKGSATTLKDKSRSLADNVAAISTSKVKPATFMQPDQPMPAVDFHANPIGIPWLDKLMANGMQDGDTMLFLGPTGGGKTVFGTQVAWARARQQKYVAYFSYEQSVEQGDIPRRILAMAAGVSKDVIAATKPEQWAPGVMEKLQAAREAYGKYLLAYSMAEGNAGRGGVEEIKTAFREAERDGHRPDMLILDWIGSAALRQMSGMKNGNQAAKTGVMSQIVQDFTSFCRQAKVRGIILAQLDNKSKNSKGIEPTGDKAADCKSMDSSCRFVLGIARLDEAGIGTMSLTKSTEGARGAVTV